MTGRGKVRVREMQYVGRSHVGLVRQVNEDGFLVRQFDAGECVIIVADGMGGHVAGEVASALAIETAWDTLSKLPADDPEKRLQTAISEANAQIFSQSATCETYAGMGTTIVAAIVDAQMMHIAHVGDSRAYKWSQGDGLVQLTEDHSYVNELVRRGQIQPHEAAAHPQRHLLMRTLGTLPDVVIEYHRFSWREEDLLLICSDGLTSTVRDEEIAGVLTGTGELSQKVDALVDAALDQGGPDNITVVALLHDGDSKWRVSE